jgi:hypothetical protein
MNTTEKQIVEQFVPPTVKHAVETGQLHKIAEQRLGVPELSLQQVVQYLGVKLAEKRQRWRPVAMGLAALKQLRG